MKTKTKKNNDKLTPHGLIMNHQNFCLENQKEIKNGYGICVCGQGWNKKMEKLPLSCRWMKCGMYLPCLTAYCASKNRV